MVSVYYLVATPCSKITTKPKSPLRPIRDESLNAQLSFSLRSSIVVMCMKHGIQGRSEDISADLVQACGPNRKPSYLYAFISVSDFVPLSTMNFARFSIACVFECGEREER